MANQSTIDLVLLDLNMPVKNGWDTFEQLTREHPIVPVIIITARPNQVFTAVSAGAGALLEKPMEMQTLLAAMEKLLSEPPDQRLARLVGQNANFDYKPATDTQEQTPRRRLFAKRRQREKPMNPGACELKNRSRRYRNY